MPDRGVAQGAVFQPTSADCVTDDLALPNATDTKALHVSLWPGSRGHVTVVLRICQPQALTRVHFLPSPEHRRATPTALVTMSSPVSPPPPAPASWSGHTKVSWKPERVLYPSVGTCGQQAPVASEFFVPSVKPITAPRVRSRTGGVLPCSCQAPRSASEDPRGRGACVPPAGRGGVSGSPQAPADTPRAGREDPGAVRWGGGLSSTVACEVGAGVPHDIRLERSGTDWTVLSR